MLEATKHIAADSTKGEFSIAKMKADYEAMIASSAAAAGKPPKIDLLAATGRKTCVGSGSGGRAPPLRAAGALTSSSDPPTITVLRR